jgi:cytochrome c biogenesis protein
VILLGAMVGSILGFKGQVNIDVGSVANEALSSRGHETIALPFAIRCDHFEATFYDSGAPKEFRSDLTLVKNGQEVLKQALRVNDPLTYDGVTLYQASYGSTLQRAEVELTQQPSGKSLRLVLPFRESVAVPDTPYHLQLVNYRDNFHNFGPALAIAVFQEGELPAGSWVLANVPNFHGNRLLDYQVKVVSMEKTAYTGLQVKKDPGTWVVLTGFVLLLVTLGLTFYSSHRRVWIWAEPRNPRHVLHIAARTNKHSLAFEREFQALLQRLREELRTGKGSTSS